MAESGEYSPALNHLGFGYLQLGDSERAVRILRHFVELEPDNPSAYDSLADGLLAIGDAEGAIAQLVRSLLLEPRFAYAWLHLGEVLEHQDELGLASAAYRRAHEEASVYGGAFHQALKERLRRVEDAPVSPTP